MIVCCSFAEYGIFERLKRYGRRPRPSRQADVSIGKRQQKRYLVVVDILVEIEALKAL